MVWALRNDFQGLEHHNSSGNASPGDDVTVAHKTALIDNSSPSKVVFWCSYLWMFVDKSYDYEDVLVLPLVSPTWITVRRSDPVPFSLVMTTDFLPWSVESPVPTVGHPHLHTSVSTPAAGHTQCCWQKLISSVSAWDWLQKDEFISHKHFASTFIHMLCN